MDRLPKTSDQLLHDAGQFEYVSLSHDESLPHLVAHVPRSVDVQLIDQSLPVRQDVTLLEPLAEPAQFRVAQMSPIAKTCGALPEIRASVETLEHVPLSTPLIGIREPFEQRFAYSLECSDQP